MTFRTNALGIAALAVGLAGTCVPAAASVQTAYRTEVMADHPLAYYRLDETTGSVAHDSSGHGFNGKIGRHVLKGQPGLIPDARTSMAFSGANRSNANEDVRIPGNPRFAMAKNLTIEAWVYPYNVDVYGKNSGDITIAAYGRDDNPDQGHCRYALELDAHSHIFHFPAVVDGRSFDDRVTGLHSLFTMLSNRMRDTLETRIVYAKPGTDGNPPEARELYHLVGTYDGNTLRFYVNGKLNNEAHVRGHIRGYLPNDGMGIGGEFVDENPVFHGRISEVAVYDHALSPERVAAHYDTGVRGAPLAHRSPARRHSSKVVTSPRS